MKNLLFCLSIAMLVSACTSPRNRQLLPQETHTTAELLNSANNGAPSSLYTTAKELEIPTHVAASTTMSDLKDLNRDFKRIPNPEIVGFVFAHQSAGIPIPGYATIFTLYEREHFALRGEGINKLRIHDDR